jgi:hypothetical protein
LDRSTRSRSARRANTDSEEPEKSENHCASPD